MSLTSNLWYLGAQFMASVQARDGKSARRQLRRMLAIIARETEGRFSHYKLRALQILTNANRAAFSAGASTDALAEHSQWIVSSIDEVATEPKLVTLVLAAVQKTIALVPARDAYHDRLVQEAIVYMNSHFAENITRDDLAARLRQSPAHFSRLFSRAT